MITPPMITAVKIARNGIKTASEIDCRTLVIREFDCFSDCILRSSQNYELVCNYIKLIKPIGCERKRRVHEKHVGNGIETLCVPTFEQNQEILQSRLTTFACTRKRLQEIIVMLGWITKFSLSDVAQSKLFCLHLRDLPIPR
jgi:hypothetical protein